MYPINVELPAVWNEGDNPEDVVINANHIVLMRPDSGWTTTVDLTTGRSICVHMTVDDIDLRIDKEIMRLMHLQKGDE